MPLALHLFRLISSRAGMNALTALLAATLANAQSACTTPTYYGVGTPGAGMTIPTISTVGIPLLGSSSFGVRAENVLAGSMVARLFGLSPTAIPILGFNLHVGAPVLAVDFATSAGVATFPI